MRIRITLTLIAAGATLAGVTACSTSGGGSSSVSGGSASSGRGFSSGCNATIAFIGPYTGNFAQIGEEQLHFTQYAIDQYNQAHHASIRLVEGDTQLQPAQAVTVTQQFISDPNVVAAVSGGSSQEILAVGPLLSRANMVDISGSANQDNLTSSGFTSFFRVVPRSSLQAQDISAYVLGHLHPKKSVIVDDQSSYSTAITSQLLAALTAGGVSVDHESVSQQTTDYSSLVSKIGKDTDLVILPWQIAANAEQFAQAMQEQGVTATIFGTDGIFSPSQFNAAGSYVASFAPDITQIPTDQSLAGVMEQKYGTFGTYGPPMYAATEVVLGAINKLCTAGTPVTREKVLAQVRNTDDSSSILGQPIKFMPTGDLVGGRYFIFKIDADKKYTVVSGVS